jgi:hypothetical protein
MNYRLSRKGVTTNPDKVEWASYLFTEVSDSLTSEKPLQTVTYPRFIHKPDGGLQFCYRAGGSGNGSRTLVDYNPITGTWENSRKIDTGEGYYKDYLGESTARSSYPNGYTYGPKGVLHTTWVWRESTQGANHDLMYAFSNDYGKTWVNNFNDSILGTITIHSPGTKVVDISRKYALMNTHGQAIDNKGRIQRVLWHTAIAQNPDLANPAYAPWAEPIDRYYYHYWRNEFGKWIHNRIPGRVGNRPKLLLDKKNNVYLIYGENIEPQEWEQSLYFKNAKLVIMGASSSANWRDWKLIHVEEGPFLNEMLFDFERWTRDGILSIIVQETAVNTNKSTLRVIDFRTRKLFK